MKVLCLILTCISAGLTVWGEINGVTPDTVSIMLLITFLLGLCWAGAVILES